MKKQIRKLSQSRGETMVEMLCAILIVTLTFAFLCTTISTTNQINTTIKEKDVDFTYEGCVPDGRTLIALTDGVENDKIMTPKYVDVYTDDSGSYRYYVYE